MPKTLLKPNKLNFSDDSGLYHVGDRAFFSKLEAVQHSRNTGQALSWTYKKDLFSKFNWAVEPQETLWELYSQRAISLREKYNYLIMAYSGGADSTNVLDAFERNNIMVDEIYIAYHGDHNNPADLEFANNLELYHVAIPRARELQKRWPNLKVTVGRMDQAIVETLEGPLCDEMYYGHNMSWNMIQTTRVATQWTDKAEWIPHLGGDLSVGVIYGKDKTVVSTQNGRYCVTFIDRQLNSSFDVLPDNVTREFFYWDNETVPMLIKQGHILKNFFKSAETNPNWFEENKKWFAGPSRRWLWSELQIANRVTRISTRLYNTLIYPYYNPDIFDIGKVLWQTTDQPMHVLLKRNPHVRQKYLQHINQYLSLYGKDSLTLGNVQVGVQQCYSQPLFLE